MTKPLTLAAVKRLAAAGESETLELKRTTGELREAAQALCGFLNQRGGVVVFGVAADGRIAGQEVNDGTLRNVAAAVRDIDPAPQVDVRRIDAGGAAPYTYDGRPFIRIGSTTRRLGPAVNTGRDRSVVGLLPIDFIHFPRSPSTFLESFL